MSASIIASVITGGTNSHQTVAEDLNAYATDWVSQGVVGSITTGSPNTGSFGVTQDSSPDMGITILAGQAYVSGTPSGQDTQVLRARMTSNYTNYTINANVSGSTKYDWIYLQLSATNASTPDSAADNVITLLTSRSTSNASDNGSPPTYGIPLAIVTVANGASSITNGNIADKRTQASLATQSQATTGWQTLSFPLTYGANNGNKEFTVTTPNNLTSTLSAGMKLNVTRSVTPPTQCMSYTASSSQYAFKTTPTGLTFTSAFTCEAWVYLLSYPSSGAAFILSRSDNSTAGWGFRITGNGNIDCFYGASSSFTDTESNQAIPLNQWVHIAASVTVSTKTILIYINGALVSTSGVASASTTLTQTGPLNIGTVNSASGNYFNGYISEARLWSVAQSQASIQNNMAINCVGNETNLVGLWQGSGNFNDSTTNANNLTATNGAVATQASNPYNAIEYSEIASVSYSNPTTTVTLHTGITCNIPNQTLNTPQYSTARTPYGIPQDLINSKILTQNLIGNTGQAISGSSTTWAGSTSTITVPDNTYELRVRGILHGTPLSTGGVYYIVVYDGSTPLKLWSLSSSNGSNAQSFVFDGTMPTTPGVHTFSIQIVPSGSNFTTYSSVTSQFIPEFSVEKI